MLTFTRLLYRQMRPGIVQFFVLAAAAAPQAQAARPFVTDDARIVDPNGYQIETYYKRQRAFREHEFWFLPAHNPGGNVELTLGGFRFDSDPDGKAQALIAQAKTLLKPLETNGYGYAFTLGLLHLNRDPGAVENDPYVNGIGSFSFADDAVVMHANLGARRDAQAGMTKGTWGLGAEIRLQPRLFGIVETYGERTQKPTQHFGLRVWVVPNRVQVDSTLGFQRTDPEHRFYTLGLRLLW